MSRDLLHDARRAAAAILAGTGLGMVARVARAASVADASRRPRPTTAIDWSTMDLPHAWTRLAGSLAGTAPVFLQLALIATAVVGAAAGVRALARRWQARRAHAPRRVTLAALAARLAPARRPRTARPAPARATPAAVRALAESGASRAEIARRTGLSQDAVGLALAV